MVTPYTGVSWKRTPLAGSLADAGTTGLAGGQPLRGAGRDADRLRLVRSQNDAPRGINDHVRRGPILGGGLGDVDQTPVLGHAAKLDRDAVGRRLLADIVEDDLGALAAVEQIANAGERGRGSEKKRRSEYAKDGLGPAVHHGDPPLCSGLERSPPLWSGMVYFRSTMAVEPAEMCQKCRVWAVQ